MNLKLEVYLLTKFIVTVWLNACDMLSVPKGDAIQALPFIDAYGTTTVLMLLGYVLGVCATRLAFAIEILYKERIK